MAVKRWRFRGEGEDWTVPINPNAMSSLFPQRAITARTTTAGATLLFEGARQPAPWTFSGVILNAAHYEGLRHWVYDIKQRVIITDHYGRDIQCVLTAFTPTPVRGVNRPWRHTYEVSATVLAVGKPTVGDPVLTGGNDPTPPTGGGGGGTGGGGGGGTTPVTPAQNSLVVSFAVAARTWTITHGFTRRPVVETFDSAGHQLFASVQHTSDTQVVVTWSAPTTGYAVLV